MFELKDKLSGKVALVTGASRGLGKGIAEMLVEAGAKVYITGRAKTSAANAIDVVAKELNEKNLGECIHVFCDHSDDKQVEALFDRISQENDGKLDILVNNAFTGVVAMADVRNQKFYESDYTLWDGINNVGLRSNYVAANLAAKMMVKKADANNEQKKEHENGLIVNISSYGGLMPLFGVAYSVGKEGNDRMAVEMARDLAKKKVAVVSIWPGLVRTEAMETVVAKNPKGQFARMWNYSEHTTYTGKAIVALAADKERCKKYSGKVVITAELAEKYGFNDIDGKRPISLRSLTFLASQVSPLLGSLIPSCVKVPCWLMTAYYSKF